MSASPIISENWQKVDRIPDLREAEAIVWKFAPKSLQPAAPMLASLLKGEERKRLERFIDQESRQTFIICRGVLHFLLAAFTNTSLSSIKIRNGLQGKPELDKEEHSHLISFNISHTQDLCLLAFSRDCDVGVDVEKIHAIKELENLARIFLSVDEYAVWQEKKDAEKTALFYEYWCAKEAILKAAGCGLTIHPSQVNIREVLANQPIRGIQENGCFFEFRDCVLEPLPLGKDYRGWLALFGKSDRINLYEFNAQLLENSGFAFADGKNVEK